MNLLRRKKLQKQSTKQIKPEGEITQRIKKTKKSNANELKKRKETK